MPKIFTSDSKGLVQKSGTGIDFDNLGTGLRLKHIDSGAAITLKVKTMDVTINDSDTTTDTTGNFVPAGSRIVAAGVEVVTASSNTFNITDLGLDGDADAFFTSATVAAGTLGSMKIGAPRDGAALAARFATANDELRATHASSGTQATDGVIRFTLWYTISVLLLQFQIILSCFN